MPRIYAVAAALLSLFAAVPAVGQAEDPFAANVRPTDPLSPADERAQLIVPPGFEVQLVAAEPDIAKPLNLAFDERGRLWITDTLEYPYAAPPGRPARDSIKILEDADGDGRAERITTFADNLNIPIGLYPHRGGVIAFSIPHIWRLSDKDGDGRADERTRLFGPFDYKRDTHGLNNAFRRGFDGWLYACHGFNNQSRVAGADGQAIQMNSGNTYRMRLDGSHVEHFTFGQVNPFGMTLDPMGNLFTADCHSKPIYQLLRGGYYPSFGAPDDGLGFVPSMMEHLHGSTAIGGVASYSAENYPPAYRGNLFTGNVMTSRVNRDSPQYHGSTILAKEEKDFIESRDPWFRPVDIVLGPDGAIYVADFYNKVIGHYEVGLDHPGRDRHRGRIWRIIYNGTDATPHKRPVDLTKATAAQLVAALGDANLTTRLLATNYLVDAGGEPAVAELRRALAGSTSGAFRAHALWARFRMDQLADEDIVAAATDDEALVRVHAHKMLAEKADWKVLHARLALGALADADAFVRRAAADAMGRHPHAGNISSLLAALARTPATDNHLRHTIRMALRDHLRSAEVINRLPLPGLPPAAMRELADVALAVPTPEAGAFVARFAQQNPDQGEALLRYMRHAARYASADSVAALAELAKKRFAADIDTQWTLLGAVETGLAQRGVAPSEPLRAWAAELVGRLFDSANAQPLGWTNTPLAGKRRDDPWVHQQRPSADGDHRSLFFCSLPRGEQLTGALRSAPFAIPAKLSFFVAGHDAFPDRPLGGKNVVRLRDAETDAVLVESTPPRNDTAQRVEWDLAAHAGRQVLLEIVDGDEADAYAWLAVGRFSLAELNPNSASGRLLEAADLAGRLRLEALRPRLATLLTADSASASAKAAAARALAALTPDARASALAIVVGEAGLVADIRRGAAAAIVERGDERLRAALDAAVRALPERVQLSLAETLAADAAGAEALVALAASGAVSPRLLVQPAVRQRLTGLNRAEINKRIAELTAKLPSASAELARLIDARRAGFAKARGNVAGGTAVFAKHCAACHQLDGKGTLVGPQLDGIGNRGLERLLEDVLDPNRNVDVAFHVTTLVLDGGRVSTGLVRREEGAQIVLVDNAGKEFSVAKSDIEEQNRTLVSIMPANVSEILSEQEFYDLLAMLLTKRAKPAEGSK